MLKTRIKKSLLEIKEKKEKILIEEKLIKTRLNMVLEGIKTEKDFKMLSEEKQLKLSVKFFQEISYLTNNGLLNEQSFTDLLKSLFGGSFGSLIQTMGEPLVNRILSAIGLENPLIKNAITSFLTTNPAELVKALDDCKLMTKIVVETLVETLTMTLQDKQGFDGFLYNAIRNQLGTVLKGTEFVTGIENAISETICSAMGKAKDKALDMKDNLPKTQ